MATKELRLTTANVKRVSIETLNAFAEAALFAVSDEGRFVVTTGTWGAAPRVFDMAAAGELIRRQSQSNG